MLYDRSNQTVSGFVPLDSGDNRLIGGNYISAVVVGNSGADTFETKSTGGTYAYSQFFGGDGNDRLIVKDTDVVQKGVGFIGGAGIDTLELTTNTRIVMENDDFGTTITYDQTGGTIGVTEVERYIIKASGDADVLRGSVGDDFLDGRGGLDTFYGSLGNDGYVFDTAGEKVVGEVEGGGVDSIFTSVSVDLRDNLFVENLRLQGTGNISGTGSDVANLITGNVGNNTIAGGLGNDSLYGKGGSDTFHFAEMGSTNKDFIWDFGSDDFVQLDSSEFTNLTADSNGVLIAADLSTTGKATIADAQVIYNKNTGFLSYDADGTGTAHKAEDIAFIGKNLDLSHSQILLA